MKCPRCGAWNQAYLPKCTSCGAPLDDNTKTEHDWEARLHEKKPTLRILEFENDENDAEDLQKEEIDDPEKIDSERITDEVEDLARRREAGRERIAEIRQKARRVRRSIAEADIIRPIADSEGSPLWQDDDTAKKQESYDEPELDFDEDDEEAPIYYDGFVSEAEDERSSVSGANYMPRRTGDAHAAQDNSYSGYKAEQKKKHRIASIVAKVFLALLTCVIVAVGGVFAARAFVLNQGMQMQNSDDTRVEITETTGEDGHPAHTITIYGRENANIFFRETQSSYVIADGKMSVTIPDYMWYDTDTSTYATATMEDTMDVHITPFIRYSQEGDQFALDPIEFTIDVPESPIYLLNPATRIANVGVSIFEVRINVLLGSTVMIDGTNVSTLIRETGNVSKNVQVLPKGENTISISVKSKYCRESTMQVVLNREPQDIQLELDATVMVEHNYLANDEDPNHQSYITGKTEPGALITVQTDHTDLTQNMEDGTFRFRPLFYTLGNNDVIITASKEGREDSTITHTVYFMPNPDIYTRKAWDLDSQYSDLVNYVGLRKGTIYMGTGTIQRILSTTPQLAIMNIGSESLEKLVLIENSSKTTWSLGTTYRIYGDATGSLYDGAPRLVVRYTYLIDSNGKIK